MKYTKEKIRKSVPFFGSMPWRIIKVGLLVCAFSAGLYSEGWLRAFVPTQLTFNRPDGQAFDQATATPANMTPSKKEQMQTADSAVQDKMGNPSPQMDRPGGPLANDDISQKLVSEVPEPHAQRYSTAEQLFEKNKETLQRLAGE